MQLNLTCNICYVLVFILSVVYINPAKRPDPCKLYVNMHHSALFALDIFCTFCLIKEVFWVSKHCKQYILKKPAADYRGR